MSGESDVEISLFFFFTSLMKIPNYLPEVINCSVVNDVASGLRRLDLIDLTGFLPGEGDTGLDEGWGYVSMVMLPFYGNLTWTSLSRDI